MSKQNNIRWRRSDYSRLSHLIRKYNQKVFSIEVKRPDIAEYQPEMLDYQTLKSQIKTRRDLNNYINKYTRYLRDGAEEVIKTQRGGVLTKWQANEIKIYDLVENAKKARTRQRLGKENVKIGGKDTGVTRAEMGSIKENATKSRTHNIKNMSQNDINFLLRLMDKKIQSTYTDEQNRKMIENYVKGLIAEGYDAELIEMLNHIDLDEFLRTIDLDETATFDFIYDPLELSIKNDYLKRLWSEHIDETINNNIDFKSITDEVMNEYANGMRIKGQGRVRTKKKRK